MHQFLRTDYDVHMKNLRRRSFLKNFIRIVSCIVVFCTTYALILPAITMENKTFCGLQEHEHTQSCYKNTAHRTLVCSYEQLGIHQHSSECYSADEELICDKADYVVHAHNQDCYDMNGYLICTLEEHPAHIHSDACYSVSEVLHQHTDDCFEAERGDLVCAIEESKGHEHGTDCYAASEELQCTIVEQHAHGEDCYEYPLCCDLSTEAHDHSDACFQQGVCICTEEENHTHDNTCYEWIPICSVEEGHAHEHSTACYATESVLTCDITENHNHEESCYKQILECEVEESLGHTHSDDCYAWTDVAVCALEENQPEPADPELICTEPIVETHIHNESCFASTEPEYVLLCTDLSEDHVHSPNCYELDCGIREHKHSLACYSDPDADIETAKDWEADFADIELTGDWPADVLTIAQTQLGYKESRKNYEVWPDDSIHGYTRYGAWYGIPYGDWCAMFVSFCLHYADVQEMPYNARVIDWIEDLTELKLYHEADVYEPKSGDLIFFDWGKDEDADHVGLVVEIIPATEFEPVKIKTLEGNSSNRVQYVVYELNDEEILGYSELPENKELYICGLTGHRHNEYCLDDQGVLICELSEHSHIELCLAEKPEHPEEESVPANPAYDCGTEEHTHVDDCRNEDGTLNCGTDEHTHNETCAIESTEPTESVISCSKDEHIHSESCYDADGNVLCELEEHTHDVACSEVTVTESVEEPKVFYCGMEEHTHTDTCFDADGIAVCGIIEHVHAETCLTETEEPAEESKVFYCAMDAHEHGEACYDDEGNLICAATEHAHTETCEIEPIIEYFCGREVHVHDEVCYGTEGTMVCPLKVHSHTDECLIMPDYQCGIGAHVHTEQCYDDVNLICELSEHIHTFACEGYTCGMEKHTHESGCYNESHTLTCRITEHEHNHICNYYVCGKTLHCHGHWCYDVNKNLACGQDEHIHDGACLTFRLIYEDQDLRAIATVTGVEWLPSDIALSVIPVTQETDPELFASMQIAISDDLSSSNQVVSAACFYDLKLISGDSVYELPETANVSVVMEFNNPVFNEEDMQSASAKSYLLIPEVHEPTENEPAEQAEEEVTADKSLLDTLIDAAAELFPQAAASELDENDDLFANSGNDYQASDITGDGNTDGLTSVTFQSNQFAPIGFALTRDASFSQYWERVESLSELKADEQYMIISAEGNYALLGTTQNNAVPVQLDPIEGHPKNYIITLNASNVTTSNLLWTFTSSNSKYTIKNVGSSNVLYPTSNGLMGSGTCTVEEMDVENCWRIKGDGRYLRFHPDTSTTQFSTVKSDSNTSSLYPSDMLIFRMLPATSSFERPANYDSISINVGSDAEEDTLVNKPDDYSDFKNESDGLTGNTNLGSVKGMYYSDIATSQLEKYFRMEALVYCGKPSHTHVASCYSGETLTCTEHTHVAACLKPIEGVTPVLIDEGSLIYEMTEKNDGMVRTDKSVIYGKDDYGAFSTYGSNTFGVTLSALGQAYPISSRYQVETPVDVVFVLDCSGSMSTNKVNDDQYRIQAMVEALNGSIKSIMDSNDENRVGVVLFAQGTNEVLPLDRYTADNDEFFISNNNPFPGKSYNVYVEATGKNRIVYRVYTSSSLKTESGDTQYQNLGRYTYQGYGTYTQAGIAMGSEVFHDIPVSDTTYSHTFDDGTTIKTQRQPVFILLSDGEPTYSTSMYTDALYGVHYGDGMANKGSDQVKGIHGFYTILSANHYKRLVGIHYNRPALFFSIGLGLNENDGTSIDYKKAVLDPSEDLLGNLSDDGSAYNNTSIQLLNLLASSVSAQSLITHTGWHDDWTGYPHLYEPTMSNPFATYSYADGSYFGNYSGQELLNKFNEILQKSLKRSEYGFVLMENSGVTMHDYIGSGMEIKGTPVLRYGGKNYSNPEVATTTEIVKDSDGKDVTTTVRTYTYSGNFQDKYIPNDEIVDLSTIVVKITDGLPEEPIYMCGNNSASHTHTAACGIYYTYLCGHHSHRLSCHEGNQLNGKLICDDPHDHSNCTPITTTQKVELIVPDSALPIYMPDLVSSNFYYEALPVRLIYQVGLTSEAQAAIAALADNGGELTFYTNRWGGSQHARSSLFPSDSNPFYYDQTYVDPDTKETVTKPHTYVHHTNYKGGTENSAEYDEDDNITDTEDYSVNCHEGSAELQNEQALYVYHELGNNGKLVFSVDTIDIPVVKNWSQGTPVSDMPVAVEVKLYQVSGGENPIGTLVSTKSIVPDADGAWNLTFTGVAVPSNDWYYAVVETPVDGFDTTYSGGDLVTFNVTADSETVEVSGAKVSVTGQGSAITVGPISITNNYQWSYELPKTGGAGTQLYIIGGLMFIVTAVSLLYIQNKRRREII